jgi:O-acetyl-ADP-ribose deacetylase (regulator of RNase III)
MITCLATSLFDSSAQTLVNTVNTVGVMGKGIALAFKQRYPEMYRRYRELCGTGELDVGTLFVYQAADKIIVNFPTKNTGGVRHGSNMLRLVSSSSSVGILSMVFQVSLFLN